MCGPFIMKLAHGGILDRKPKEAASN